LFDKTPCILYSYKVIEDYFPQQFGTIPKKRAKGAVMATEFRFNSIDEAVQAIKEGRMIILVDDEDRENEGDLVMAAEKCPVSIIHPGTPLNPGEKDLAKWVKRAARFS